MQEVTYQIIFALDNGYFNVYTGVQYDYRYRGK